MESEKNSQALQAPDPREPIAPPVPLRVAGDTLVLHLLSPFVDGATTIYAPAANIVNWCDLADGGSSVKLLAGGHAEDFCVRESPDQIATMRANAVEWRETRHAAGLVRAQLELAQRANGIALPR